MQRIGNTGKTTVQINTRAEANKVQASAGAGIYKHSKSKDYKELGSVAIESGVQVTFE